MKVYSLLGAASVGNEDVGTFKVDKDGAVEVPEPFGVSLRDTHINGVKAWEDENERHARLAAEELERRRDPANLYDAVAKLTEQPARRRAPARKRAAKKPPPVKKAAAATKAAAAVKKPAPGKGA